MSLPINTAVTWGLSIWGWKIGLLSAFPQGAHFSVAVVHSQTHPSHCWEQPWANAFDRAVTIACAVRPPNRHSSASCHKDRAQSISLQAVALGLAFVWPLTLRSNPAPQMVARIWLWCSAVRQDLTGGNAEAWVCHLTALLSRLNPKPFPFFPLLCFNTSPGHYCGRGVPVHIHQPKKKKQKQNCASTFQLPAKQKQMKKPLLL